MEGPGIDGDSRGPIGRPYLPEGNLTAQSYLAMLTETLPPVLENCGVEADDMWWQRMVRQHITLMQSQII